MTLPGDAIPGAVTLADYTNWKRIYGIAWAVDVSQGIVPEPAGVILAILTWTLLDRALRRRLDGSLHP